MFQPYITHVDGKTDKKLLRQQANNHHGHMCTCAINKFQSAKALLGEHDLNQAINEEITNLSLDPPCDRLLTMAS